MKPHSFRTWIEIDTKALRHNVGEFFRIIPSETRFMAVIKSNAYGHGLALIAKELAMLSSLRHADPLPAEKHLSHGNNRDPSLALRMTEGTIWFGVDSIVEALRLRREGITNPILVLGFTLPNRMEDAAREHISISISHHDAMSTVAKLPIRPMIHLKLDTGMHRQGFLEGDMSRLVELLKKNRIMPEGIFTHFAAANNPSSLDYTHTQFTDFTARIAYLHDAGFKDMIRHAAATGGALLFPETHLDMVRVGMGLYGYWPSEEAKSAKRKAQNKERDAQIKLKPVLTWKTIVAEVKIIPKGSYVGYDSTERVKRTTTIAVLPIGYWHGYDRGLSSQGHVLVRGARARVLGRVSMDMMVVDVSGIPKVRVGDEAVLIGRQGKETIDARELGNMIGTSPYEFLTRINPLIKRVVV